MYDNIFKLAEKLEDYDELKKNIYALSIEERHQLDSHITDLMWNLRKIPMNLTRIRDEQPKFTRIHNIINSSFNR